MLPTYYAIDIVTSRKGLLMMAQFLGLMAYGNDFVQGNRMMTYDARNKVLSVTMTKQDALKLSEKFNFEFQ